MPEGKQSMKSMNFWSSIEFAWETWPGIHAQLRSCADFARRLSEEGVVSRGRDEGAEGGLLSLELDG